MAIDLSTLEGLLIGSAVAATDSAAIFAVLRNSRLRKPLARALEGESGMNDPVALLLVTGFIDWIQMDDYGLADMAGSLVLKLAVGLAFGIAIGWSARWCFRNLDLPSPGLYPVASIATMALAYGVPELVHGSGFLSVYIAALILGTGRCRRSRRRSPSIRVSPGWRRSRSSPCSVCSCSRAGSATSPARACCSRRR